MSTPSTIVYYHGGCTDGFAAAFAVWLKYKDKASYIEITYDYKGFDINDCRGKEVYIVDFSFPSDVTIEIFKEARKVIWLDHHETSRDKIKELGVEYIENNSRFEYRDIQGNVIILDINNRCGSMLTWDYIHNSEPPMFFKHIDDYDRWKFDKPYTMDFMYGLNLHKPYTFEQLETMYDKDLTRIIEHGSVINNHVTVEVKSTLHDAVNITIDLRSITNNEEDVYTGLMVNSRTNINELGMALTERSKTFGLVWYMRKDGSVKCSFRSIGDYDTTKITTKLGGGGNVNTGGCYVDIGTIMSWID